MRTINEYSSKYFSTFRVDHCKILKNVTNSPEDPKHAELINNLIKATNLDNIEIIAKLFIDEMDRLWNS
jgi:hypothetical protein